MSDHLKPYFENNTLSAAESFTVTDDYYELSNSTTMIPTTVEPGPDDIYPQFKVSRIGSFYLYF